VSTSDSSTASDATSTSHTAPCSITESVTATDTVQTAATVIAQIQENIAATDVILRRLLWEQIDDDQVPGWTDILRPQLVESVMTFGGAFFGDVAFASAYTQDINPNPVFWVEINDTQTPNWTEVVQ
jgi:hypothetical protein